MQLSSLHIYPVKSGRVINLETAVVEQIGLQHDRRWVIVKADVTVDGQRTNRFISQRSHPHLARLIARPDQGVLHLSYDSSAYSLDLKTAKTSIPISVWKDNFDAHVYQDPVNDWLSEQLGGRFRLAVLSEGTRRRRETDVRDDAFNVSFADGYPVLITTTMSLEALNAHIRVQGQDSLSMSRFRPNIVIDGTQAWEEDSWKFIKIGDVTFECVKPCTRCIMTTLDPATGESQGDISLKALTHLRQSNDKRLKGVLFGINAIPLTTGRLYNKDKVEILETQNPWAIAKPKSNVV